MRGLFAPLATIVRRAKVILILGYKEHKMKILKLISARFLPFYAPAELRRAGLKVFASERRAKIAPPITQ
jgi:hypothetical protein